MRSKSLQAIITDAESVFDTDVWKNEIQTKIVNKEVVRGLYNDFLEDPLSFKFDVLWVLDGTTMLNYLWFLIE